MPAIAFVVLLLVPAVEKRSALYSTPPIVTALPPALTAYINFDPAGIVTTGAALELEAVTLELDIEVLDGVSELDWASELDAGAELNGAIELAGTTEDCGAPEETELSATLELLPLSGAGPALHAHSDMITAANTLLFQPLMASSAVGS